MCIIHFKNKGKVLTQSVVVLTFSGKIIIINLVQSSSLIPASKRQSEKETKLNTLASVFQTSADIKVLVFSNMNSKFRLRCRIDILLYENMR